MQLATIQDQLPLDRERIDRLGDEIALTAARIDAATHDLLDGIRRFDEAAGWAWQGARTCAHWLSWRIGIGLGTAREQVRVARALSGLPLVNAALSRGELSYSKVRAITRVATAENESLLLQYAQSSTGAQLERICRSFRQVLRMCSDEHDRPSPEDERYVRRRNLPSGMVRIEAQLHPDEADLVMKALAEARRGAHASAEAPSQPDPTASAETPPEPTLADGLVLAAESFLAHGALTRSGAERTQLFVHLYEDRLHDTDQETFRATLTDGTILSGPALQRLACDAGLVVAKHDAAGDILDIGRKRRTIPPALARALWIRDGGCRFPGCQARAFCEAHHIEHWSQGGPTSLANTCLLCRFHHTLLHEGGFRITRDENGELHFSDPHGRRLLAAPSPPVIASPLDEPRDPRVNLSRWDGAPADYGACVSGLLARTLLGKPSICCNRPSDVTSPAKRAAPHA